MGARGQIRGFGNPIPIRFPAGVETKLRYYAQRDELTIAELVRNMVAEGLDRRVTYRDRRKRQLQSIINDLIGFEYLEKSQKPMAMKARGETKGVTP